MNKLCGGYGVNSCTAFSLPSDEMQSDKTSPLNLIVLAGGHSSRMGSCKYCMRLEDHPLHVYPWSRLGCLFQRLIMVENAGMIAAQDLPAGSMVVPDLIAGVGPLGGIYTGLTASDTWLNFVVAADMPFAVMLLAQAMTKYARQNELDVLYPWIDGLSEPLFAVYSKKAAAAARNMIAAGRYSIQELFDDPALKIDHVGRQFVMRYDQHLSSFFNINVPDDLVMAELMMHLREKSLQEERVCR